MASVRRRSLPPRHRGVPKPAEARDTGALVLAFAAERAAVHAVEAEQEGLREAIATAELHIATRRDDLEAFAERHAEALASEHALVARIDSYLRYLRQLAALTTRPTPASKRGGCARPRQLLDGRRDRELKAWHARRLARLAHAQSAQPTDESAAAPSPTEPPVPPMASELAGKAVYRALARRFHPDLAPNEGARARHSALMAHINALYRARSWQRLAALAAEPEATNEAEAASHDADWHARLIAAQQRLAWHREIHASLEAELAELEQSTLAKLALAVQQAAQKSRLDPFAPLRRAARARAQLLLAQLPAAIRTLEERLAVPKLQPKGVARRRPSAALKEGPAALAPLFDPELSRALSQLSLEALAARSLSPRAKEQVDWLAELADQEPALVRLTLFAYVAHLGTEAIEAVSSYDALSARFAALGANDRRPISLAEALVQGDGLVTYRVVAARNGGERLRLSLREAGLVKAMPGLLQIHAVRELFADILGHLGEAIDCRYCRCASFAVPLFWLRGLDTLRALVCSLCGAANSRYVLARGDDVQAILNQAYLDFALIEEARLSFGQRSVGVQLLARDAATFAVSRLQARLAEDLFARNGLAVPAAALAICDGDRELSPRTVLGQLYAPKLSLRLLGRWRGREQELTDELRFRIRTRYAPRLASPEQRLPERAP